MRFRKKPVEIEAMQWTGDNPHQIMYFMGAEHVDVDKSNNVLYIETLEGRMAASNGDWIIRGIKGEYYPCKPEIFAASYDDANKQTHYESGVMKDDGGYWQHVLKTNPPELETIVYHYNMDRRFNAFMSLRVPSELPETKEAYRAILNDLANQIDKSLPEMLRIMRGLEAGSIDSPTNVDDDTEDEAE